MKHRIYNESVDIESERVQEFFEKRFCKENPLASVMVRGSAHDDVPDKRNQNETRLLYSLMDLSKPLNILDVGCGCGRWASNLDGYIMRYDGIDFAQSYVDTATEIFRGKPCFSFHRMPVTDLTRGLFPHVYDLIIVNGLCMYLNDVLLNNVMDIIHGFVMPKTSVYLRESVSVMGQRLTLKDFPSVELNTAYNAIYRTPEEYERVIGLKMPSMRISSQGFLLTEETGMREETNQKYWFLQAGGK